MKKNSGFTLIELVVVMAILAILAGVAVPAYSGYIKKANETADQQKIEAVETAMQSALAMEGKKSSDANKYFVASFVNNKLTIKKVIENVPSDAASVWDNFANFYAGDSTAKTSYELELNTSTTPKVLNITVSSN